MFFYIIMIVVLSAMIYAVIEAGDKFESVSHVINTPIASHVSGFKIFSDSVQENIVSPVAMLLLQVIAILFTARILGWCFNKMGQPTVIGEIVAGIVLGPSVLAHFFPEVSAFLFAPESLGNINILSQIGLILFMFAIGMELDLNEVKKTFNETLLISHTSTFLPFFLGTLTAYFVYPYYASDLTSFVPFALFVGIAMSITAFPVLARIIQEKGLTKTRLGVISIASAANGDISAWCLLAIVIAIAQAGTISGALYTILFSGIFLLFMFFVLRPFLRIIGNIYHNKEVLNRGMVAFIFLILIISAYTTEILGIHALFGAFIIGVVMPSNVKFRKIMTEKVEDVALSIFLPLFFVSTGLRTQIGLIRTGEEWLVCLVFTLVAIIGKFGGAYVSALVAGETQKNSLSIGALMNTRGLMELVVLTIGYEMNILPPSIFAMLVLMTLVTTFMTTPLMSFIDFCYKKPGKPKPQSKNLFRILLSFGRASNGSVMLNVANQLFPLEKGEIELTALHLTVGTDVNPMHVENFREVSFEPILQEAERLNLKINTRYEISGDAGQEIVNIVNTEGYDFLLVGAGISMSDLPEDIEAARYREAFYNKYFEKIGAPRSWFYPGDLLQDKTKKFIEDTNHTVGIFVNRDFEVASSVIVILQNPEDLSLLDYTSHLIQINEAKIGLFVFENKMDEDSLNHIRNISSQRNIYLMREQEFSEEIFLKYNFMLIGYNTWNQISETEKEALQRMPSTLIINKRR